MEIIKQRKTLALIIAIVIIASIPTLFFFYKYQKAQKLLKDPSQATQNEVEDLVKKVSAHVILPEGEKPTVATVSDVNKLKNQSFFKDALNGDKVLIYSTFQKAIIYRPSTSKIVAIAPINLDSTQNSLGSAQKEAKKSITIALYNGTETAGLSNKYELNIAESLPEVTVTEKNNASNDTYKTTQIIALTKVDSTLLKELVRITGGEIVTDMPKGEKLPGTDVLIILGASSVGSN